MLIATSTRTAVTRELLEVLCIYAGMIFVCGIIRVAKV